MSFKQFLKPDWRKIVIFFVLLFYAPFLYLIPYAPICIFLFGKDCALCGLMLIFGFPFLTIFLPKSIRIPDRLLMDTGIDISVCGAFTLIMFFLHLVYVYFLSCFIVWIYDKVKRK